MARAQKLSAGEVLERALHPTLDALIVTQGDPTGAGTSVVALNTSATNDTDNINNTTSLKLAAAVGTTMYVRTQPLVLVGTMWDRWRRAGTFKTFTLSASAAETTIWTPAASRKFRLLGVFLFSNTATVLTFRDGTGGTVIFLGGVAANTQLVTGEIGNGIASAVVNNVLTIQCGTAATVSGTVWGCEET
jgi:hypothetical protein